MRRHHLELIAALAEGSLDDETEARALVESSDALRAEYEAQRSAIEALRSSAPGRLSEHERASLRRDVWTELHARGSGAPSSAPWYLRWTTAAAALALVIGSTAVVIQMSGQMSATDQLADAASTEDIGSADADSSQELTRAADSTDGAMAGEAQAPAALEEASTLAVLSDIASLLRAGEDLEAYAFAYSSETDVAERAGNDLACLETAGLDQHQVLYFFVTIDSDSYVVAAPEGDVGPGTVITFVDADTCEVVHTDG